MPKRFQVIIVGGGPVGVGLAVELGLRGISCAVIERRTGLQNIPKGQNLTPRTLEHFYFWGIVDELRAARIMPKGYPISGITTYGTLLGEYWYPTPQRELVREFYFRRCGAFTAVPDRESTADSHGRAAHGHQLLRLDGGDARDRTRVECA